jgi:hypothetical protein
MKAAFTRIFQLVCKHKLLLSALICLCNLSLFFFENLFMQPFMILEKEQTEHLLIFCEGKPKKKYLQHSEPSFGRQNIDEYLLFLSTNEK